MTQAGFNPFEMARAQFDKIADLLGLDAASRSPIRTSTTPRC